MRRDRNTKIIATLGPASSNPDAIRRLFKAGADVFRINMSHTSGPALKDLVSMIRSVELELKTTIGILADLQGPKIRIGEMAKTVTLEEGATVVLDRSSEPGDASRIPLPHPEVFDAITRQSTLLINDGKVRLHVQEADEERIECIVDVGGEISSRKGVNLPDVVIPISALTSKDREDLEAALNEQVDWIALSFVQRAQDIIDTKELVAGRVGVLAKIEKPAALNDLDNILAAADAIMVARGDLGVELPLELVPGKQMQIVRSARKHGKPVVIATQMLESMIESPVPTRAEVSDVAKAVFDGADAVMLSAESAVGKYAKEAVATMNRIAIAIEGEEAYRGIIDAQHHEPEATTADAITAAASQVAHTISATCIACYTTTGSTALRAARERPDRPILVLTPSLATARRLAFVWGVTRILTEDAKGANDLVNRACGQAKKIGFAKVDDRIVITAGLPVGTPGTTNLLRIARVHERH
ncbi:MAG: pyruvate kinase [Alphaproteobacteria bacterium]|nr:MAG: pyruvate kinase [Alphaproteobacteria bacterium]